MTMAQEPGTQQPRAASMATRLLVWVPLVCFLALAAFFLARLFAGDPSRIPSALIGHPVPQTQLPPVEGLTQSGKPVPGLDNAALQGSVSLVNVWASWCAPCREEAPVLLAIPPQPGFKVVGINYKDDPENARRFLGRYGNPFAAIGADRSGRTSIDWGVYGVPETYVVDRQGRIAFKLVGGITPENWTTALKPAIDRALASH